MNATMPVAASAVQKGNESAMKTFFLHGNQITVGQSRGRASADGTERFRTEREFAKLAVGWPGARLREIWNALPNTPEVHKFTDRKTAVHRIWKEIQKLKPVAGRRERQGTKTDQILALLRQPSGATLESITKATGWQAHSVRGFMSGTISKKMGLNVTSSKEDDGDRNYSLK